MTGYFKGLFVFLALCVSGGLFKDILEDIYMVKTLFVLDVQIPTIKGKRKECK